MNIKEACDFLKKELLNNGYKYGFYCDGRKYLPDQSGIFDTVFFDQLFTIYRVQEPEVTMKHKIAICHDTVVLMRKLLADHNIPSKIWLQHDVHRDKYHTVLTFYLEGKTIYLELTPEFSKPWYGKELIFDSEEDFIKEYSKDECEVIDVTDSVIVGEQPKFVISRVK